MCQSRHRCRLVRRSVIFLDLAATATMYHKSKRLHPQLTVTVASSFLQGHESRCLVGRIGDGDAVNKSVDEVLMLGWRCWQRTSRPWCSQQHPFLLVLRVGLVSALLRCLRACG